MTTILTDKQLQQYCDLGVRLAFKDRCEVLRGTRTPDPSGGYTTVWAVVATYPCLVLDAGGPAEQIIALQQVGLITKMLMLPRGADLLGNDRARINGSLVYTVVDLFDPTSFEVFRRALIRRSSLPLPPH